MREYQQLDLFVDSFAKQYTLDKFLKSIILQGQNIRYLITRIHYCYELSDKERELRKAKLEDALHNLVLFCDGVKVGSSLYYKTDFSKLWAYNPAVTMTESPSQDDIESHARNCWLRYKAAILSNKEEVTKIGPIVDVVGKLLYYNTLS